MGRKKKVVDMDMPAVLKESKKLIKAIKKELPKDGMKSHAKFAKFKGEK